MDDDPVSAISGNVMCFFSFLGNNLTILYDLERLERDISIIFSRNLLSSFSYPVKLRRVLSVEGDVG